MQRRRKKLVRGVVCLVYLVVLVGCGLKPNLRSPQKLERSYEHRLIQWTVSGQVYHGFNMILHVHATYLSESFRKALKNQYHNVFGIDPDKVDTDLEMVATSAKKGHEFFFFTDTSDFTWNNLEDSDSVWRVALWGGDEQPGTPPIAIHRFNGRGPNLKAFFPYINDFGRSYYVVFPLEQANGEPVLDPKSKQLIVKMASAFGEIAMTWKVEK